MSDQFPDVDPSFLSSSDVERPAPVPATRFASPPTVGQVLENTQPKPPTLQPTTIAERQEITRGTLATSLIGILRLVIGFLLVLILVDRITAGIFAFTGRKYEYNNTETKDIATLLLTSLSGLVGTALGFYFGSRNPISDSDPDN